MSAAEESAGAEALLSLHDVLPETLDPVGRLLRRVEALERGPATLLVVPGRRWSADGVERLRGWAERGHRLAAHGWLHSTRPRRLFHRLHAAVLSRDVAEHLDLDGAGIVDLMRRSRAWFGEHDLPAPTLYVPPAWALGPVSAAELEATPFRTVEVLGAVLRPGGGDRFRREPLPLVGFEADTRLRAALLRRWNRFQVGRARRSGRRLRISVHPQDPDLLLADQLEEILQAGWRFVPYD